MDFTNGIYRTKCKCLWDLGSANTTTKRSFLFIWKMTKHDQTLWWSLMMVWSRAKRMNDANKPRRSCGKVTVVNNNTKWFKPDDGKKIKTKKWRAKSDLELHIKRENNQVREARSHDFTSKYAILLLLLFFLLLLLIFPLLLILFGCVFFSIKCVRFVYTHTHNLAAKKWSKFSSWRANPIEFVLKSWWNLIL